MHTQIKEKKYMIFFSPPKHDPYLKTIIIYVKSNCNIVINKKYIYGLSDDQDIFLIYICSLSTVPGSQLLKPLKFPEKEQWEHLLW